MVLSICWVLAISLLLASLFLRSKSLGLLGDGMLAISFGFTAFLLVQAKHFWTGAAFAFPALRQAYVLRPARFRKNELTPSEQSPAVSLEK
jgi:hypothetical protein